jgi:hypothetical protein
MPARTVVVRDVARRTAQSVQRSEVERLELFVSEWHRLREEPLAKGNNAIGINVKIVVGAWPMEELTAPEETQLRSLLLGLRRFVAKGDDLYLHAIFSIADRRLTSDTIRTELRETRQAWADMLAGKTGMRVRVNEVDFTPEQAMDLFINAWYFHNDPVKVAELEKLMPLGAITRYQFLRCTMDTLIVVALIGNQLERALDQGLVERE